MPYANTVSVKGLYVDQLLKQPRVSDQPRVLVIGPASSGLTGELFFVGSVAAAEREYGSSSAVIRGMHEVLAQGAATLSIMRSGGRQGSVVVTDSLSATLTITPRDYDASALTRYSLIMESDGAGGNRILIYDLEDETWVYDSSEVLVLDEGIVEVIDTGIDNFTINSRTAPDSGDTLSSMVTGDFTATGVATLTSVTKTNGDDGTAPSYVERYATYESTYHNLDFKDGDFIYPIDVYVDTPNAADGLSGLNSTYGLYWKGVPVVGDTRDVLGYVWHKTFQGTRYTFFTDSSTYFTDLDTAVAATRTVDTDIVLTALVAGKGGNAVTIEINAAGAAGPTVTVTETTHGFDILVVDDGTATRTETIDAINTALEATTLANGVGAETLVEATLRSGGSGSTTISTVAKVNLASGAGGHVLTHQDLTGEDLPPDVLDLFEDVGADAQLRECNFAHQLATFCYLASTTWSTLIGAISFTRPVSNTRPAMSEWAGQPPVYTDNGSAVFIDAVADNGTGVLGNKFMSGLAASAGGYRNALVVGGNSVDGYAYGGFIKTVGASLPDGEDFPYGIDDGDEDTDDNLAPIDLGKHIIVTGSWAIHRNGYNGGSSYMGPIAGSYLGKLATLPENQEPIGDQGRVARLLNPPRIHSTQLDQLGRARVVMLREQEGTRRLIFSCSKTAAHPDSDYAKVSTIRCVNRHLKGLRQILRPYLGKPANQPTVASIQAEMDQYLQQQRVKGFNQAAKARISYTQTGLVLGRMNVSLRIKPPFCIEEFTVSMSLAADETEI